MTETIDTDAIRNGILNNLTGPRRAAADNTEVEQQTVGDMVKALEKLDQIDARNKGRYKVRIHKMTAGGAVE